VFSDMLPVPWAPGLPRNSGEILDGLLPPTNFFSLFQALPICASEPQEVFPPLLVLGPAVSGPGQGFSPFRGMVSPGWEDPPKLSFPFFPSLPPPSVEKGSLFF